MMTKVITILILNILVATTAMACINSDGMIIGDVNDLTACTPGKIQPSSNSGVLQTKPTAIKPVPSAADSPDTPIDEKKIRGEIGLNSKIKREEEEKLKKQQSLKQPPQTNQYINNDENVLGENPSIEKSMEYYYPDTKKTFKR